MRIDYRPFNLQTNALPEDDAVVTITVMDLSISTSECYWDPESGEWDTIHRWPMTAIGNGLWCFEFTGGMVGQLYLIDCISDFCGGRHELILYALGAYEMTLGPIIQEAMDIIGEPANSATGKFSLVWWTRQVNKAQRALAQRTGYKLQTIPIQIAAKAQRTTMPSNLCWGIQSIYLGTTQLTGYTHGELDEIKPGWRFRSEIPYQGTINQIRVNSNSDLDVTPKKITLYGITTAGDYVTEDITLTGTSWASSVGVIYDQLWLAELSTVCAGIVTIQKVTGPVELGTIAVGSTTLGSSFTSSKPSGYVVSNPYIEWNTVPDAGYSAWLTGGALPDDFSTATSLADETAIDSLPAQFHSALANGAAAFAEVSDFEVAAAQGRLTPVGQQFLADIQGLNDYLNSLSRDRMGAISVDAGWNQ